MGVVNMDEYRHDPHLSGDAVCLGCRHKWVAVSPAGHHAELECPECRTYRGVMEATCAPDVVYTCDCGCDVYRIAPDGAMCLLCGVTASFSELME